MESIQWRSRYNIGDSKIDADHQWIVNMLKKLQQSQDTCLDPDETARLFDELEKYAQDHFSYEEDLLEQIGFPFISSHKKDHESFRLMISDWRNNKDIDCKSKKISIFLTEWLFEHILHYDMKIREYLPNETAKEA